MSRPNFSGEWTLVPAASILSAHVAAASPTGFVRIDHDEPNVTVRLCIVMDGKPFDVTFERMADGPDISWTSPEGDGLARLRWDGDALVFTDMTPTPNGAMTIVFRYELQDEGRRLRATERLRGAGRDQDNVWVFERAI